MKSREEIRQHLDNLEYSLRQRCNCSETGHDYECIRGSGMLWGSIVALEWVLGINAQRHDAVVKEFARRSSELRGEVN